MGDDAPFCCAKLVNLHVLLIKVIRLAFALFYYCSFIVVINFLLSVSLVYFWGVFCRLSEAVVP